MSTRWDDLPMAERERIAAREEEEYDRIMAERREAQQARPCSACGSLTDPIYGPRCADCAGG